jgi:DNA repair exonuclease SbcCD ATPase subunit
MTEALDIQKVISTSTSDVSLDDLNKKGFKQVKVLNQTVITRLISEAVDRVLEDRSREISRGERDKVIKEARTQFEALARDRLQKERGRIGELEQLNVALQNELETARKRQAALMESQAERDQALVRLKALELELSSQKDRTSELEDHLSRKEEELRALSAKVSSQDSQLQEKLTEAESRLASLQSEVRQKSDENSGLIARLSEAEKDLAATQGQLEAKKEELERLSSSQQSPASEQVLAALTARLEEMAKPSEVNQIMMSLDSLSRKIANLGPGHGGGSGGGGKGVNLDALFSSAGEGAVESNVSKVKVKQAKAGDVRGALAKLRKLQKGGEDGE